MAYLYLKINDVSGFYFFYQKINAMMSGFWKVEE